MTEIAPSGLGAVYTRAWVSEFILDLAGYSPNDDLGSSTIIEPCCGEGSFVIPIVRRLLSSLEIHGRKIEDAESSIAAYDLDAVAVDRTRGLVRNVLAQAGVPTQLSAKLAASWVKQADFLLTASQIPSARWIVGNPPYVRVEDVDSNRAKAYRSAWPTMTGRADVYIGFFEAALSLVEPGGAVTFLCADRWMKNQYGAPLRKKIVDSFSLELVLELHNVDVFEKKVAAYPAVTLIRSSTPTTTVLARAHSTFDADASVRFRTAWTTANWSESDEGFDAHVRTAPPRAATTWAIASSADLALVEALEANFPTIEETGVAVHGGIATGADDIFITNRDDLVERSVLLPIMGPLDVVDGRIDWTGRYLINPWGPDGLLQLADVPMMAKYFEGHSIRLKKRYVAKNHQSTWWRTIDRPNLERYAQDKLLVADIKNRIEPVLDRKGFVPMHSVYFITSKTWDLRVLGGLLMSDTVGRFLAAYSVVMSSGAIRVSAQYLRLIRLPQPETLPSEICAALALAFETRDRKAASVAARAAFNLLL